MNCVTYTGHLDVTLAGKLRCIFRHLANDFFSVFHREAYPRPAAIHFSRQAVGKSHSRTGVDNGLRKKEGLQDGEVYTARAPTRSRSSACKRRESDDQPRDRSRRQHQERPGMDDHQDCPCCHERFKQCRPLGWSRARRLGRTCVPSSSTCALARRSRSRAWNGCCPICSGWPLEQTAG